MGIAALGGNKAAVRSQTSAPSPARVFDADSRIDSILHRSCANCHSSETKWPWYAKAGPVARMIQHDVSRGREKLNFSEDSPLDAHQKEEILDAVSDRSMPPRVYVFMHPEAQLSARDVAILQSWANH